MRKRTLAAAILAPVVAAAAAFAGIALAGSAEASTTRNFYVTLYGWPDNSPPGDGTAFGSGHAGGTGTYSDPITFATDQDELAPGTKVYYPYLHRYFIMEDECVECDQDWANGKYHIDLWIGGEGGNTSSVLNCEDALTQDSAQVVLSPPSNEPVDTTPLFNSSTNKCYDPSSFHGGTPTPTPTGGGGSGNSYVGAASGKCIDDPNSSTTNGTQLEIWTCHGSSNQQFTATGGTLQVLGKCLDAYNNQTANNTKVEIWSCNGGANQQWSYNSSNGTIVGAQSGKCLTVQGASTSNGALLILYTCNGGSNQKWTRQ
jgi:hypothetical protein